MNPLVSIIIPVFNQLEYTKVCLAALLADQDVLSDAEIVIVDSGSSDATAAFLASQQAQRAILKVQRLVVNQGFSAACNAGAAMACGEEFVFLNNDTIPLPGWLPALRKTLALPRVGLVGPKLLYPDTRRVNHAGYVYSAKLKAFYPIYHQFPEDFAGVNRRREFQALLGACIILRRELFLKVGAFSDFGFEDIDLCLKVREQGCKIVYEPRATVLHHGSVTLRNSPPGTIPPTDGRGFLEHWPDAKLIPDDHRYYGEDGMKVADLVMEGGFLGEVVTESAALTEKACQAREAGNLTEAVQCLEKAIAIYSGNEPAYQELISQHIYNGHIERAIFWAKEMVEHVSNTHKAMLTLAQLLRSTNRKDEASSLIKELLLDWTLDQELRVAAERLLQQVT